MNKTKISLIIVSLLTAVAFQNCSEVNFQPTSGSLMPKIDNEEVQAIDTGEGDETGDDNENEDVAEQGAMNYICILKGPGKSVRLGIMNEVLQNNGRTPDTVCLSRSACLDIVSQKFEVKGAEVRGFCSGKNPHVAPLTDAQITAKIAELALQ